MSMFLVAFGVFFIFLFAGAPIAFSMGLGSIIGLVAGGGQLAETQIAGLCTHGGERLPGSGGVLR